jgi:hypothetical protein
MMDDDECRAVGGMIALAEETEVLGENLPSATLPSADLT